MTTECQCYLRTKHELLTQLAENSQKYPLRSKVLFISHAFRKDTDDFVDVGSLNVVLGMEEVVRGWKIVTVCSKSFFKFLIFEFHQNLIRLGLECVKGQVPAQTEVIFGLI
jgi:hypothetical protein